MGQRRHALVWVAVGAAVWGTDTLFRRPLTAVLAPARIVLYEHLIAAIVLIPVAWRTRGECRALNGRQWFAVLGIAWGGSALGSLCFTKAVQIGNPTTAVLLQKIQPVFAALLAHAVLRERLGRRFWMWLGVAIASAYLVSFGLAWPGAPTNMTAALLALGAALLWGCSTVLGRYALRTLSFAALTALRILCAVPVLLILARGPVPVPPAADLPRLTCMALIPGLAALLIYYHGLEGARASRAAIAELAFPASAALLNYAAFGARIAPAQAAGFVLLCVAILTVEKDRRALERVVHSSRKEPQNA